MARSVRHTALALVLFALAACVSPPPPAESGQNGGQSAGETGGKAMDNGTAGSGALIGNIWF